MCCLTKKDIVGARCDIDINAEYLAEEFQPIFEACSWKWAECGVPTVKDIDIALRVLAGNLCPGGERSVVASGRLEIFVTKSPKGWVTTEARIVSNVTVSVRHEEDDKCVKGEDNA